MSYFLRIENKKKGPYLQLYERYWNKEKRQCRTKCVKTFGYLDDLKNEYMNDPVAYYKEYAANLNRKKKEKERKNLRNRHRQRKVLTVCQDSLLSIG